MMVPPSGEPAARGGRGEIVADHDRRELPLVRRERVPDPGGPSTVRRRRRDGHVQLQEGRLATRRRRRRRGPRAQPCGWHARRFFVPVVRLAHRRVVQLERRGAGGILVLDARDLGRRGQGREQLVQQVAADVLERVCGLLVLRGPHRERLERRVAAHARKRAALGRRPGRARDRFDRLGREGAHDRRRRPRRGDRVGLEQHQREQLGEHAVLDGRSVLFYLADGPRQHVVQGRHGERFVRRQQVLEEHRLSRERKRIAR